MISYAKGDFPKDYVPTVHLNFIDCSLLNSELTLYVKVFDNYAVSLDVGGQKITLHLMDTAGMMSH